MTPSIPLAWRAAAALAVAAALVAFGYAHGVTHEQNAWALADAARAKAEKAAILDRVADNAKLVTQQAASNAAITKAHNAEIDSLRARLAAAPRLRIGAALCGGPAVPASPAISGSRDAVNPPGRLVRDDIGRDIDALKLSVEIDLATGRACQATARANGMAP